MVAPFPESTRILSDSCHPLPERPADSDFRPLLDALGAARFVLLGEASHGTHEFYDLRARITRLLIEQHGFAGVVVEADWPDAYRVNRYVRGARDDPDANSALQGFRRFPQWMWRNRDVVAFVEWLRRRNAALPAGESRAGFYGMDLYSLYTSIEAVLGYLDRVDPDAARRARHRYSCFEDFGEDPQAYGYAASIHLDRSCQDEVLAQLVDLQRRAADFARLDGQCLEDEYFFAEQNARLVKNAEEYYRQMFAGRDDTWNLRDTHMADTIAALADHLDRTRHRPTRLVMWAHNSHLGDARATQMGWHGEINVGQLCRQRWGAQVFNLGFTTHTGLVTAATDWDAPAEFKRIQPSLPNSYERLFFETGLPRFLLIFARHPDAARLLEPPRLERAIGVIYRPRTERQSHYFQASLPAQFDAVVHINDTTALQPLEPVAPYSPEKAETFPTGI